MLPWRRPILFSTVSNIKPWSYRAVGIFLASSTGCNMAVTIKSQNSLRNPGDKMRIVKILSVFAVLLVLATVAVAEGGQVLLNAAGATFPYPIYSKWFDQYHQ